MNNSTLKQFYNHPIELGLRVLFILSTFKKEFSINQLINLDYLILYSKDIGGKENLHPIIPNKTSQILVKRNSMKLALNLLLSKELIKISTDSTKGILFSENNLTKVFVDYFDSNYSNRLKSNIDWVFINFKSFDEKHLQAYIDENIEKWGSEFIHLHQNYEVIL